MLPEDVDGVREDGREAGVCVGERDEAEGRWVSVPRGAVSVLREVIEKVEV